MAIGRLSVTVGTKGKASPHAQYIAREGKYAKPSNHAEKLEYTGHGNMPKWAEHDPNYFWKMADEHERKNGSTYREHVIALPRELSEEERHELVKDWIEKEIGDKHAYQYAIHNPPALDGGEQPHAHIMFSERTIDGIERDPDQYFKRYNSKNPEKGGAKKANTPKKSADRKAELKAMRERWEVTCNAHLEKAGSQERISMKSLKEQGITREPINFSMAQMSNPETEAFKYYVKLLELKEASEEAELQAMLELGSSVKAELNLQTARQLIRQEEETQRQAEAEAIAQQQARAEAIFDEMEAEAIAQQEATTSYTELLDRIDASRIRYDVKQQLKTIVQATEARFREDPPTQQDKYRQISEKIDELEQQRIIDNDRGAER